MLKKKFWRVKAGYLGVKTLVLTFTASGEEDGGYTVGSVSMTVTYPPKNTFWRRMYNLGQPFCIQNFTVKMQGLMSRSSECLRGRGMNDTQLLTPLFGTVFLTTILCINELLFIKYRQ